MAFLILLWGSSCLVPILNYIDKSLSHFPWNWRSLEAVWNWFLIMNKIRAQRIDPRSSSYKSTLHSMDQIRIIIIFLIIIYSWPHISINHTVGLLFSIHKTWAIRLSSPPLPTLIANRWFLGLLIVQKATDIHIQISLFRKRASRCCLSSSPPRIVRPAISSSAPLFIIRPRSHSA